MFDNGTISEATYTNDLRHGLERKISEELVTFTLWKNNLKDAEFTCDEHFAETSRHNDTLNDLYAYQFALNPNDTLMVENMLQSSPLVTDLRINHLWRRIKPMTFEFAQDFWIKLNTSEPLNDLNTTHYDYWL